ncbi:MAG: transglutaminase [Stygiobacter sp.]|nr:MAG: transglutaminase [Stygiobacter sp.]KAF0214275.1 MAG: hypothetical protein FD178_2542 [Ignavibacteria bacterium]
MHKIIFMLIIISTLTAAQTRYSEINLLINQGNFSQAQILIESKLAEKDLAEIEKSELHFQIDAMDRIRKDFKRTREEIITALKKYYPELNDGMLVNWEKDNSLEMKMIDGEKLYFNNAVPNLFRINKEAKAQKEKIDGTKIDPLETFLKDYIPKVYEATSKTMERIVLPVKMKIKYTLTLKPNAVPDSEVIRCWLPYPKETNPRQTDIQLLRVSKSEYTVADDKNLQRTIYLEETARKDQPTKFEMELAYTSKAEFVNLFESKMPITFNQTKDVFDEFTKEEFPHIVFTERIKNLSNQIIGDEKNPLQILKKIFTWVDENTPWASAREYSTIPNIPEYSLEHKHGDCRIQTLVFMTLCRYNGIPAKWQSGWMMHPPEINLHDWCEIYVDGYGWIPVDQSFGIKNYLDETQKYFYLGGIDAYRLIVNDAFSKPLYPAKIFPRSETVDFQRGEVEWRCGNLYFDKWNYDMEVKYEKN